MKRPCLPTDIIQQIQKAT